MLKNEENVDIKIIIHSSWKNQTEENTESQSKKRKSDKVATKKK